MYKLREETFDAMRWDGENQEIVQGQMGYPTRKGPKGILIITLKAGDKEKDIKPETVTIKKGNFAIKGHLSGAIVTCDLEEFELKYKRSM